MNIIKHKKQVLIWILGVFLGLTFLAILLTPYQKDILSDIIKWLSGLSSFLTLIIALLLFEKFGLDKKIKERREDAVLKLFDDLIKTTIIIESNDDTKGLSILTNYFNFGVDKKINFVDNRKGRKILISNGYIEIVSKLREQAATHWLPKNIQRALFDATELFYITKAIEQFNSKYVRIIDRRKINYPNDPNLKYHILDTKDDLESYLAKWQHLYQEINQWLNKNTAFALQNN